MFGGVDRFGMVCGDVWCVFDGWLMIYHGIVDYYCDCVDDCCDWLMIVVMIVVCCLLLDVCMLVGCLGNVCGLSWVCVG